MFEFESAIQLFSFNVSEFL